VITQHSGISDLLRRAAERDPERRAIVAGDRYLSRGELDAAVNRAASALRATGAVEGDRVLLQLPTGADFVILYLATLRAGLVAVPVNPANTAAETDFIRRDSGAGLDLDVDGAAALLAGATEDADPGLDRAGEAVSTLIYTSGTSGAPKAAILTSRALLANLEQLAAVRPPLLGERDVLLVPLPLTHIFGLNAGLGMALAVGACAVLVDRFDVAETLGLMVTERVSAVLGVPTQFAHWLADPNAASAFHGVRLAMSGSARLPASVAAGFAALGVVVHDGYGLTEAAPVVALSTLAGDRTSGSIGRPLPGVEVELRDDDGEAVDDGDPGRIFVRGPNLFSGYWPDGSGGPDGDGWFGTGDLAVRDDGGALHLVGRSTDLVIVNGFNVYPAEVETVLAAQPGVAEAAVVGVPDDDTGEAVRAYLVAEPGVEIDPAAVLAGAARALARFKLPRAIEVVSSLPHTITGKVMKWRLFPGDDGRSDGGG
jgi:long-chain acyl-CoA synthetase